MIVFICISCGKKTIIELHGYTMGTTYSMKISENDHFKNIQILQDNIDSVLFHINEIFSTYIYNSEISTFNRSDSTFKITDEFKALFLLSKEINKCTMGAFDPTVHPLVKIWGFGNKGSIDKLPKSDLIQNLLNIIGIDKIKIIGNSLSKSHPEIELDFSAIAKGYGVDEVSQYLLKNNIENFMVEIGGEVYCHGTKFRNEWKIGLQNPFSDTNSNNILKVISLNNMAMATSGNYRNYFEIDGIRYSHTIDPKTGYPVKHDIISVSVIANNCATADAYATALMVLGIDGLELINSKKELEAVIIYGSKQDFKLIKSRGMNAIMKDVEN